MEYFYLLLCVFVGRVATQCNFPSEFIGTWVSSNDGTWVVNSSHLLDFKVTGISGRNKLSFSCYQVQGTQYALQLMALKYIDQLNEYKYLPYRSDIYARSTETVELFSGIFKSLYTCLDIRFTTTVKYIYYKSTDTGSTTASEFTTQSTFSNICNKANYDQPYYHHVALLSGSETSGLDNCPSTLFGSFHYDTCSDSGSTDTSMNVCDTRQQLIYDYTLCNTKQMFSADGVLDCVYFVQSGTIAYLTVYNRDVSTPDNVSYFRFTCLAIEEQSDGTRKVTANPEKCLENQNPSSITSPGQAIRFTPYYLCQITTTTPSTTFELVTISSDEAITTTSASSTDSETNIGLIIGIIVALIIILIIVALIILCCCLRKRRRKKQVDDEEKAIAEDTDDQRSQGGRDSERRGSDSGSQDEDKRSIDSGIGREPPSGRVTGSDYKQLDDQEQEEETVKTVGDVHVDDKTESCRSEQVEKINDNQDNKEIKKDHSKPPEDKINANTETDKRLNKDDNDLEEEGQTEINKNKEDKSKLKEHDIHNADTKDENDRNVDERKVYHEPGANDTKDLQDGTTQETITNEENKEVLDKTINDGDSRIFHAEENENIILKGERSKLEDDWPRRRDENDTDNKTNQDKDKDAIRLGEQESEDEQSIQKTKKHRERKVIGLTSDGEEIFATDDDDVDDDSSLDDSERERRKIGQKKQTVFTPAGPLTTVLVSREEEERKRNKLISKSKRQKMRKLAKKKTKKHNTESDKEEYGSDVSSSEEDESKLHGLAEAPHMEQYRYKKKMDVKLDEEHYWSDDSVDRDALRRLEDFDSSIFSSTASLTDTDDESRGSLAGHIVDKDGNVIFTTKGKANKHKSSDKKLTGDTGTKDKYDDKYKRKDIEKERSDKDFVVDNENETDNKIKRIKEQLEDIRGIDGTKKSKADKDQKDQTINDSKFQNGGARLIHVKEHEESHDHLQSAEVRRGKKTKESSVKDNKDGKMRTRNDITHTDETNKSITDKRLDKYSDTDSGVEDEEILDVVLTEEQQQMIVKALFDEDMNLRSEFGRDENGRIVRKLDNTVIYDPYTGRLTFRRRLGRLFNAPRLKRNIRGRPTGGYIEDEYGPKYVERQKSSLSRGSGKGLESRMSSSASLLQGRRSRSAGRNVGFSVPDNDVDAVSVRDLEFHKRGRRDIGSGIRRKLKNRLFRKKRKKKEPYSSSTLQPGQPRTAWTRDTQMHTARSDGELGPVFYRKGRGGYQTPTSQRHAHHDSMQWQGYRQGLETDRKILAGLQDNMAADRDRQRDHSRMIRSYSDFEGESSTDQTYNLSEGDEAYTCNDKGMRREPTYWTPDGHFAVRERGCPEIQPVPLFKILRRPGTIASYEQRLDEYDEALRSCEVGTSSQCRDAPKSAPAHMTNHEDQNMKDQQNLEDSNENSTDITSSDSQGTYIDDWRLRRLLEELYRDKKYFDQYLNEPGPASEVVIHTKGLAEHGRGYLLQRADYWEKRGPLPCRPPQTEIGWKMQRQQTMSAQTSELDSTSTITPNMRPYSVPGYVDIKTPRDNKEAEQLENETIV